MKNAPLIDTSWIEPLPTVAPAALILPSRHELNQHWLKTVPSFAALSTWHEHFSCSTPDEGVVLANN